jgi:hypothetical protein
VLLVDCGVEWSGVAWSGVMEFGGETIRGLGRAVVGRCIVRDRCGGVRRLMGDGVEDEDEGLYELFNRRGRLHR